MGLKQDIVVKHQFKIASKSLGNYAIQYMARKSAVEVVAPIIGPRLDLFATRYMARADATERAGDQYTLKNAMAKDIGMGGVAFGYGHASLSHDQLKAAAKDLQKYSNAGHVGMTDVLSFDLDYLKKHKLVDQNFQVVAPGDFRGNLDQMKLRLGIMAGLDRLSSQFSDLRYIGVIQIDTEHVHCHLAMIDAGEGRRIKSGPYAGQQRGKLSQKSMNLLRRSMDNWLDEKQHVRFLSSAVGYERRNVVSFVKRWAHEQMAQEGPIQMLAASLPEDRSLWRADTRARAMQQPNAVLRGLIEDRLHDPRSGMTQAMAQVQEYALYRRDNENLSVDEYEKLVAAGRERIIKRSMNGVYNMLRKEPEHSFRVRTPMLEVMTADMKELEDVRNSMQPVDEVVDFSYKLRSYSQRLTEHSTKRKEYTRAVQNWDNAYQAGIVDPSARALRHFYEEEEEYEAMLAAKYRSFFNFSQPDDEWVQRWEQLAQYGDRMVALEQMMNDPSLARMKDEKEAEEHGLTAYGQSGGRLVSTEAGQAVLRGRLEAMTRRREVDEENLRKEIADAGFSTVTNEQGVSFERQPEFPFSQTRGLDLHRLGFDFMQDTPVSESVRQQFVQRARLRREVLDGAVAYLQGSGQAALVSNLPVADIEAMEKLADHMEHQDQPTLPSEYARLARVAQEQKRLTRRSPGTSLDAKLRPRVEDVVDVEARREAQELRRADQDRGLG